MSKKKIKIGFIGAGSIGSLFGGYLAAIQSSKYNLEIFFFCRKAHAEAINAKGLKLEKTDGIQVNLGIKAYEKLDNSSVSSFDYLFLCTKTYDIEKAMVQYKNLIEKSNWLVILQNGIGNEDIVKKYCSEDKIIRIVTSNGALLKEPGYVVHTGIGFTNVGFPFMRRTEKNIIEAKSSINLLKDILDISGIKTTLSDDIIKDCWEKVFVNAGINPFGALTRLKNGLLLENEGIKEKMEEAVIEAVKVARLKNIKLSEKDYVALMFDVAEKTYDNKNSMLQDILKGKKTEVDFINGRIVKYANELGIKVLVNEVLTYLIKGLEQSFS